MSSFDLLLEYLKLPEAESVFKGQACAYSLSLLEPAQINNNLAFNNWETSVKAVNDQTHFTNVDFTFPGTIFGSWIPRSSNAHLTIHSGILAAELKRKALLQFVLFSMMKRIVERTNMSRNGMGFGDSII